MTTTAPVMTSKIIKKQLLASHISLVRSLNNEKALKLELSRFFENLKQKVLKELTQFYNDEFMFQAHADLILSPIFESQKEYYEILEKFNQKEFRFGVAEAKRLTRLSKQKARKKSKKYLQSLKSETQHINPEKLIHTKIEKDELFGTNPWTEKDLLRKSFIASENTMNRVDKDINKILSEGYQSGKGIKEVRNNINRRFDQLKSWEANRIARTEIHNSHQQGIMNTYHELGVEYTQWSAAQDDRTRDSHMDLDGEIIPIGGKFSNGLSYPGDTSGPIEEWINCRCSNIPFIIPEGFIAPSFSPFHESDLIPTLDKWNGDELIQQAISEPMSNNLNYIDNIMQKVNTRTREWDVYRLTPQEREVYLQAKKNYEILKDAFENKNYDHLDEIIPDDFTFIKNKKTFLEDLNDGAEFIKEEMADYLDDIKDYEKIIKDTNISVDITPKPLKSWHNEQLKEWEVDNESGKFNHDEQFISYTFKKEGITVYESVDMDSSRVRHVYKQYKDIPKKLRNFKRVILSAQEPKHTFNGVTVEKLGGYVLPNKNSRTIYQFKKPMSEVVDTLVHESFHLLEKNNDWYISNSKDFVIALNRGLRRLELNGTPEVKRWPTPYAKQFTFDALKPNTLDHLKYGHRAYSEVAAESMKMYLKNPTKFREDFPELAEVMEDVLQGKYDNKKNILSYDKWIKQEKNRFALTSEDLEKRLQLELKETELHKQGKSLSKSERNELTFYSKKSDLNYLHNQYIEGKLNPKYVKQYKELLKDPAFKKFKPKKDNPLSNIVKRNNGKQSINEILHENEELLSKGELALSAKEQKEYLSLLEKRENGELTRLKKKKLKRYEDQLSLNKLYKKGVDNLNKMETNEFNRILEENPKLKTKIQKLSSPKISRDSPKDTSYTGDINNIKNIKQFKGTTKDGMLPGNEYIDDYFTKDVSITGKYDEVITDWCYNIAYKDIQFFDECGGDVGKLRKRLQNSVNKHTPRQIEDMVNEMVYKYNRFEELMKGAETKKNMRFYRRQRNAYMDMDALLAGKTVKLDSARSYSISREGTMDYTGVKKGNPYKYELIIDVPAGTEAVYIAPKAVDGNNKKYIRQMETIMKDLEVKLDKIDSSEEPIKIYLKAVS